MKVIHRRVLLSPLCLLASLALGSCTSSQVQKDNYLFGRHQQSYSTLYSAEVVWTAVLEEVDSVDGNNVLAMDRNGRLISWISADTDAAKVSLEYPGASKYKDNSLYARVVNVARIEKVTHSESRIYVRQVRYKFHRKKNIALMSGSSGRFEEGFVSRVLRRISTKGV